MTRTTAELLQLAREGSVAMRNQFNKSAEEYKKSARELRQCEREQAQIIEDIDIALKLMRN